MFLFLSSGLACGINQQAWLEGSTAAFWPPSLWAWGVMLELWLQQVSLNATCCKLSWFHDVKKSTNHWVTPYSMAGLFTQSSLGGGGGQSSVPHIIYLLFVIIIMIIVVSKISNPSLQASAWQSSSRSCSPAPDASRRKLLSHTSSSLGEYLVHVARAWEQLLFN